MIKNIFLILVLVAVYGCASVSDIKSVPLNHGNSININMGLSDSISHIKSIAGNRGLELRESYIGQSGEEVLIYGAGVSGVADGMMTGVSYGEWVRVSLLELTPKETKVFIYTKKKAAFNAVGSQQHSQAIINELKSL